MRLKQNRSCSKSNAGSRSDNVSDQDEYFPSIDSCGASSDDEEIIKIAISSSVDADETDSITNGDEVIYIDICNDVDVVSDPGSKRKHRHKAKKKRKVGEADDALQEEVIRGRKKRKKRSSSPILMWQIWEEEHERWLDENMVESSSNLENNNFNVNVKVEPPMDLIIPLLRYQKEWLAWGLEKEESTTKGGILADEMGMGKTIQAISLVLAKREIERSLPESSITSTVTPSTGLFQVKCTLVVCPVVAVMQWVNEIDRFTKKGSTKVLVYHGANRGKMIELFVDYDFVITTYSIIEFEYRKNVMPPKEKCMWCGKNFYKEKMAVHLRYYCGPHAIKTEKQSKQEKKKGKLKGLTKKSKSVNVVHDDPKDVKKGLSKKGKPEKGNGAMSSEKCSVSKNLSLHSVKWNRIILDEGHYIKDRRCNTARAVLSLESTYRWALSGTPLQNRVGELYSLVRFLRIVPYSYYMCKDCDCRILDYCATNTCSNCPHKSVRHFCWWNRYITKPILSSGSSDGTVRAMILLRNKILKNILLRRTKKGKAADLALPPTIISLRRDAMDIKEEDYYISLYNESHAQFNTYVEAGTLMNNYAHIFDLLTRLRQAVDHPYLVVYSRTAAARNQNNIAVENTEKTCSVCHDTGEDHVVSFCDHIFCKACLVDFSLSTGQATCPSCSKPLTIDLTNEGNDDLNLKTTIKGFRPSSILNRIQLDDFQTSTKIEALREEIRFMLERDGSAKGIVFSQFTSFLDLINYSLQKSGIACVQLVGSMSIAAREAAISKFTNDPTVRIFLMSLKAGGVALNLTVASHVFLMDPWWNPAVEMQARDRIHRIGQYKSIRIVRFVIENTIEERILKLQEKKQLAFDGTVGGSAEALGQLTSADIQFLFAS